MKFVIPKEPNYTPDEGWHDAVLYRISYSSELKHRACNCMNKVRFTFHLDTDPREPHQDVAAVTFCMEMEHADELKTFLQKWLGKDFRMLTDHNGALELEQLDGRPASILIQHIYSKARKHDRPFCKIADIKPRSDLQRVAA